MATTVRESDQTHLSAGSPCNASTINARLEYWERQLANSLPAELPCDRPGPSVLRAADVVKFVVDTPDFEQAKRYSAVRGFTLSDVLVAAFRATHYRLTRTTDALLGTACVEQDTDLDSDCPNTNTHYIRLSVHDDTSFDELVQQTHSKRWEAIANEVPCGRLRPLVKMLFGLNAFRGEEIATLPTGLDLECRVFRAGETLQGTVVFSAELFTSTPRNMIAIFLELLRRGTRSPNEAIADIPLTDGLRELGAKISLVDQHADYPRNASIVDEFCLQALRSPNSIAVNDTTKCLTYAQLDEQSDYLACALHRHPGHRPRETLIGVYASRSCETIVAFLGILKAGFAYLPLDVHSPPARIESILSSIPCQRRLVLVGTPLALPGIRLESAEMIRIDQFAPSSTTPMRGTDDCEKLARCRPSATSLAYVMFTSGSSGMPKGVMVEHRGIVRLIKNGTAASQLPEAPRIAHLSNIAFDACTWEIYSALLTGGTVVCIDYADTLDTYRLGEVLAREQIQAAMFISPVHKACIFECPAALASFCVIHVGGEPFPVSQATKALELLPGINISNAYGPTENTCLSTLYPLCANTAFTERVPIGRPISHSGAHVMDRQQRLVPLGVVGELVVTGDGIARGYTDPRLDKDRFIEISVDNRSPTRAYRTGDCVRLRPTDGEIEFLGRIDEQIKIRGYRVELSEVEHHVYSQLTAHTDAVLHVVAEVITPRDRGQEILVAFVAVANGRPGSSHVLGALRGLNTVLRRLLPDYMIPVVYLPLDRIPTTLNGKVDRRYLRETAGEMTMSQMRARTVECAPTQTLLTASELRLAELWSQVLGVKVDEITAQDNFMHLGGDSIRAMQLCERARGDGLSLSVAEVFQRPQLSHLAEALVAHIPAYEAPEPFSLLSSGDMSLKDRLLSKLENSISPEEVMDILPATHVQAACLDAPDGRCYHFVLDLPDAVDLAQLREACNFVFQSLDTLRTVFVRDGTQYYQAVLSRRKAPIAEHSTMGSMETFCNDLLSHDLSSAPNLGTLITQFIIVKASQVAKKLSIRMSHCQYDGIGLGLLAKCIGLCFRDRRVVEMPRFSGYVHYQHLRRATGEKQWRSLLHGSQLTKIAHDFVTSVGESDIHILTRCVPLPRPVVGVTPAFVFAACCVRTLGAIARSDDVVLGMVVTGRSSLPHGLRDVFGPCINTMPLRARADSSQLPEDLQQQYTDGLPFETLDFDHLLAAATEWEDDLPDFPCTIQYQDIEVRPEVTFNGSSANFRPFAARAVTDRDTVAIFAQPKGGTWEVSVCAATRYYARETVESILDLFVHHARVV
ncbi:hypothetical protein TI39_contig4335g00007 [Zymoseptoria brevis]|uniref:Carrier domain-containing protein n=1 Tax=Zymoseptoria brevis TaxID=1047168 RepID=A0A0F4G7H2_9PEZI|nr:hypothetical protein TI39_contig4335g00007 [Zymoseptoria brevis]